MQKGLIYRLPNKFVALSFSYFLNDVISFISLTGVFLKKSKKTWKKKKKKKQCRRLPATRSRRASHLRWWTPLGRAWTPWRTAAAGRLNLVRIHDPKRLKNDVYNQKWQKCTQKWFFNFFSSIIYFLSLSLSLSLYVCVCVCVCVSGCA